MSVTLPIETERLLIRSFDANADSAPMLGVYGDPDVMRFIPGGALADLEAVKALLERYANAHRRLGFSSWGLIERASDGLIGDVGFGIFEPTGDIELGYTLGRSHWGRGYATEAAGADGRSRQVQQRRRTHRRRRGVVSDDRASFRPTCWCAKTGFVRRKESVRLVQSICARLPVHGAVRAMADIELEMFVDPSLVVGFMALPKGGATRVPAHRKAFQVDSARSSRWRTSSSVIGEKSS
jgi:hypothetical protein